MDTSGLLHDNCTVIHVPHRIISTKYQFRGKLNTYPPYKVILSTTLLPTVIPDIESTINATLDYFQYNQGLTCGQQEDKQWETPRLAKQIR